MKRQITQFDTGRSNATVATPTCSSCCCCCCCLTTALASSTILARRINKEAKEKNVGDPKGLTLLAALFLPVIGLIVWGLYTFINGSAGSCEQRFYQSTFSAYSYNYEVCTKPANALLLPFLFIVPVLVLSYLYARVRMGKPVLRAILVTVIIWIAVIAEAIGGAMLILTGVGGIIYLLLVPVLFGVVQAFYGRKILHREVTRKNSSDAWRS